jgi:predicted nucleotidyltransferase
VKLPDDFRDLLVSLVDGGADFVIVGGFAVAHHGYVRATKDIDVLVRATPDNAAKLLRALASFGAPIQALGLSESDFVAEGRVVQLGVPPLRVDLLTSATGIDYATATAEAATIDVDGRAVRVIGLSALLKNKRAAGRPQDLADVAELEKLSGRPPKS